MLLKGVTMRSGLAAAVCVLALLAGCASETPPAPKDPKLLAREAYMNALAERCERDASALREQAIALELKAKGKDLKAMELRKQARDAAEGKIVDPEPEQH